MKLMQEHKSLYSYMVPALSTSFLIVLTGITIFSFYSRAKQFSGEVIAESVVLPIHMFNQICNNGASQSDKPGDSIC